jgi:hypothetical protein
MLSNSAKDKMILEEAYSKNPKPDKVARQDIVQRVTLNEKEVQVSSAVPLPSFGFLPVDAFVTSVEYMADTECPQLGVWGSYRSGSRTDDRTIEESRVRSRRRKLPPLGMAAAQVYPRTPSPPASAP